MKRGAQSSAKWVLGAAVAIAVVVGTTLLVLRLLAKPVTVTEAVEGPVVQAFYSTGTIQPVREYPIRSNLAGILTAVHVDKGDEVKAGQPLAVVSDPELTYGAAKAQADYDEKVQRADPKTSPVLQELDARISATQALLDIAQREEQRIRNLAERQAAAQTDLDLAIDRLKTVWSNLESFKAQRAARALELERELAVSRSALDTAKWNLEQQTLRAPIDGVVLDRPLAVGTRVAINDPIMRTADVRPQRLVMRAAVDEEDVTSVHVGQTVRMTLYSYEGRTFEGKVQRVYPQADEARRTFEVDVEVIEPDGRFSPGMTGELAFIMDAKERAVVVPSQAIQQGAVYAVRDNRLAKLDVTIGLRGIERTEIAEGVRPGERVVISAVGDLSDGQRVRPTRMDPVAAAGLNKPKVVEDNFKGFN